MKIRKQEKIPLIKVYPGDSVTLTYINEHGVKHEALSGTIDRPMRFTQAVIFDVEEGDFPGAKGGIGGAFLDMGDTED